MDQSNESKNKSKRILTKLRNNNKETFSKLFNSHCPKSNYVQTRYPPQPRVIVFGDIHGDLQMAKSLLIKSGVAKFNGDNPRWTGGKTFVVQTGDQMDRCRPIGNMTCANKFTTANDEDSDLKILSIFTELHNQAVKVGGSLISLLGNHEILNAQGMVGYVSKKGIDAYKNYTDKFTGQTGRENAFKPGTVYGKHLGCNRSSTVIIGSNIFVHAGIVDGLIEKLGMKGYEDLDVINKSIRKWLMGLMDGEYIKDIIGGTKHSMFWTRILGKIPPGVSFNNDVCKKHISQMLQIFQVGSITVGHTPQSFLYSDDINGTCSGKVWRVDNGSSAAFDKFDKKYLSTGQRDHSRRYQWLEIINDDVYNVCDERGCKKTVRMS